MLGLLLLLLAIILYFQPKYRYISYFLYLSFMLGYNGGFGLWTDQILGIKNHDLAVIFTGLINIYLILNKKIYLPRLSWIKFYNLLVLFIAACFLFSLIHYQFSFYQVFQGGRNYLLIASLPILIQVRPYELNRILQLLIIIVSITSILYILQIIIGRPIMPYNGNGTTDPSTGLIRLYNSPYNVSFFLTLTFILPNYFKGPIALYRLIFFCALLCTLGRTGIFSGIMMVLLALLLNGKFSSLAKYSILIAIMLIPFIGTLSKRFEKGGTQNDIQQIMKGQFDENYQSASDATLTYRFAWIYERAEYLSRRPLGEQIFGLGLISDSQKKVHQMYHFKIGLFDKNINQITQLSSPDTSYGNLIVNLGFAGTIIYMIFAISLTVFFVKNRNIHPLFIACSSYSIILFIISFSGNSLSQTKTFSFLFIFIPIYLYHKRKSIKQ